MRSGTREVGGAERGPSPLDPLWGETGGVIGDRIYLPSEAERQPSPEPPGPAPFRAGSPQAGPVLYSGGEKSPSMLKLFDRYILREILPPFGIGIVLFTFVLLMNQILVLAELFIAKGVPFGTAVEVLALLIPSLLAFAVPMAVLMGILAGLSRLSSDLEITAFRTLGVGFARFLKPLLLFAAAGWAVTSALTLWVGPRANHRWVKTVTTSVLARVQLKFVPREFNESVPGMIVFVRDIAADESWRDVFVAITTDPETPRVILARRGRLNLYPEAKRATLELEDGEVHSYPRAEPEKYRLTTFRKDVEEVDVSGLFSSLSSAKRVREKDIGELRAGAAALRAERARLRADLARPEKTEAERASLRRSLSSADRDARAHGVEIHKKFALPFACFIFVLIGLPLGATTRKGGRTSGFTLSIGIIIAYYILITAGEKFAMDGRLAPAPAMWGPDILLALAGLALLVGTRREWRFRPALFRRRRLPGAGGAAAAASPADSRPPSLPPHPRPLHHAEVAGPVRDRRPGAPQPVAHRDLLRAHRQRLHP